MYGALAYFSSNKSYNFLLFSPIIFSVGRRKKPPEVGLRAKYYTPRQSAVSAITGEAVHSLQEPLVLPPTKLEEKRTKLLRLYERKEKKRLAFEIEKDQKRQQELSKVDAHGNPIKDPELSDYEKNKLNNGKSHIEVPTCSSGLSTWRTNPSATQRGTKDRK